VSFNVHQSNDEQIGQEIQKLASPLTFEPVLLGSFKKLDCEF